MAKITIFHLYPDAMNLYGDFGNIQTLKSRCGWRDIETEIVDIKRGDTVDFSKADIVFMGGGQDRGQKSISSDLLNKGPRIKEEIEKGWSL
jgi:CobQ-like glutamine amidotransferase family enzyme